MHDNRRPTIIIFATAYLPLIGGAELAIKEITDRISDYDFFLITARMKKNLPKRERIGNIEVFRVGFGSSFLDKPLSPFWGAMLARELVNKHNVKVKLFWSMMVSFTSGAPFLLKVFGLNKKIPILLTLQEGDSERHLKFSNLGLTGVSWFFAMRLSDRIQAISSYLKDFAIRMGARREVEVVPNGVAVDKVQIPNKFQIPNSKTVITVSRLVYKNGIDILIKAIAEVKKEIPDVKLWVLGGGIEENNLKKLAQDLKIAGNIEFLGEIPNDQIYEHLSRADIFVRPSRSEGLGTAFLEAMAAGLPVIATPVGGIPDFLKDGETGLFSKLEDSGDLSEKILKLFNNDPLREKLSAGGRQLVWREYSWDNIAVRMRGIFNKLIMTN